MRHEQAIPYDAQNPETEAPQGIMVLHEKDAVSRAEKIPDPRGSQRKRYCWIWKPSWTNWYLLVGSPPESKLVLP